MRRIVSSIALVIFLAWPSLGIAAASPDFMVSPSPSPEPTLTIPTISEATQVPLQDEELTTTLNSRQISLLDAKAADMEEVLGVPVLYRSAPSGDFPNIHYTYSGSFLTIRAAMVRVGYELSKYPKDFLSNVGIKGIYLFAGLSVGQRAAYGVSNGSEVVLDASTFQDSTIHHELMHCFEYNAMDGFDSDWTAWTNYNTDGFRYSELAYSSYKDGDLLPIGMISPYSMSKATEDRAEVFSFIMSDKLRPKLWAKAAGDSLLRQKALYLLKWIDALSPGDPSGRYWNKLCLPELISPSRHMPMIAATVAGAGAGLYSGPNSRYPLMDTLAKGDSITIIDSGRDWHRVIAGSKTGYVRNRDIRLYHLDNPQLNGYVDALRTQHEINVYFDPPQLALVEMQTASVSDLNLFLSRLQMVADTSTAYYSGRIIVVAEVLKVRGQAVSSYTEGNITILSLSTSNDEIARVLTEAQ